VHQAAKLPLFMGFEMSKVEQEDRLLSLTSRVSLSKIMNGTFSAPEEKRIEKALTQMEAMRSFILSSDITSGTTISGVQAKMQEYSPDVVFIDGAYLMQSELDGVTPGSPQALTDISRSLKRLAQSSKTPIVVTTQASLARSKGGLTAHSAMYTQAWGQDCDVLLGVERMGERKADETGTEPVPVKFRVIESRSGPRKEVVLEWDWHRGSVQELDPAAMKERLDRHSGKPSYATDDGSEDWHGTA
jgi:replicative DNA helicase